MSQPPARSVRGFHPAYDVIHHFENRVRDAVQVILFFFGIVNAGASCCAVTDTGSTAMIAAGAARLSARDSGRGWRGAARWSAPATASRLARAGCRRAGDFERFHDRVRPSRPGWSRFRVQCAPKSPSVRWLLVPACFSRSVPPGCCASDDLAERRRGGYRRAHCT